jgi:hypothetical protein
VLTAISQCRVCVEVYVWFGPKSVKSEFIDVILFSPRPCAKVDSALDKGHLPSMLGDCARQRGWRSLWSGSCQADFGASPVVLCCRDSYVLKVHLKSSAQSIPKVQRGKLARAPASPSYVLHGEAKSCYRGYPLYLGRCSHPFKVPSTVSQSLCE